MNNYVFKGSEQDNPYDITEPKKLNLNYLVKDLQCMYNIAPIDL